MKKSNRCCLLLMVFLFLSSQSFPATPEDRHLIDSIFESAYSQPNDSLRSVYLRNMFQRNLGKQWTTELLDSALVIAAQGKVHSEEIATCYDYFRHYQYHGDMENMERQFNLIKEYSYRYKDFENYFNAWNILLQSKSAKGDTEYVIMEVDRMKKEAARLKYKNGEYIAQITLAQAYYFSGKAEEAARTYQEVLKYPGVKAKNKILIYGQLANIRLSEGDYEEGLKELKHQRDIIDQLIRENPENQYLHKSHLLEVELSFCRVYLIIENKELLRKHLEEARKYYTDDCFFSYFINYHTNWGGYYYLTKEWDKCFKEFDIALNHFGESQPLYEHFVRKMKAQVVMAAGLARESAEIYRQVAIKGDSLNKEVLRRHEEVHQANYKIQKALFDKEKNKIRHRMAAVIASALILVILLFTIVRALFIQRQLRHSEREIHKALDTITAADKMKERFLQNITYEIRTALNAVVGLSDLLSVEKNLPPEEVQEYSAIIRNNSGKLLLLINNVLDLSRLEAGMMRFNVQPCDAVQLCREAKMMAEMKEGNPLRATFQTELESLSVQADSHWFLRLVSSVLSAPNGYDTPYEVVYTLTKENKNLQIKVQGSLLCQWTGDEQERRIQHEINRLYLHTFKGNYRIVTEAEQEVIVITYPLS